MKTALALLCLALCALPVAAAEALAPVGAKLTLDVQHDGTGPAFYQWMKEGKPITGATAKQLVILSVTAADAGNYSVRVSNAAGEVISDTAAVSVVVKPTKATTTANVETR